MLQQIPLILFGSVGGGGGGGAAGKVTVDPIDLTIIIVYMVGIIVLGCWAGMRRKSAKGADYFLAGKSLRWPMIGMALFATNISTIHLVMLAQSGYCSGLLYGNFEWMAGFTLILLAVFFAPLYIRSGVSTIPDFIEKRYNRNCRDIMAVLCIFSAVVIHIGFSLYAGARVLEGCLLSAYFPNPEEFRIWTIIIICGATALYTIIGGLMAVVVTESIQTVVLIIGAICITLLGLYKMGGWSGEFADLYYTGQMVLGWSELKGNVHPSNFGMCRPDSDPTGLSWYVVFAGYWISGVWYWCTDQTIVQRVLGAKNETHARIGPLFAAFIKILPVFIFVLPGLICLGLINKGVIAPLPLLADGTPDSEQTYSHLINNILPIGARGIVVAALLAALMSTVSGALNSIATLVSYDIFKRWRPTASDRQLITVGRAVTFGAMIIAVLWSLMVGFLGKSIFQAMVDMFCAVAPPTTVIFMWGIFWRRASAKAALITLIVGATVGSGVTVITMMKLNYVGDMEINSLFSCFLLAVFESIIMVVCSYIFPQEHTEESSKLVWKTPLEALKGDTGRGWNNFRVWLVATLVAMIALYWYWWGEQPYYPVRGTVTLADGTPVVGAEMTFDCDNNALDFTAITDSEGKYVYASKKKSGGAPEGTEYKVKLVPKMDLIVQMKEEVVTEKDKDGKDVEVKKLVLEKVLYEMPAGTDIKEETLIEQGEVKDGKVQKLKKDVYTFTLTTKNLKGDVIETVVNVPRGELVKIVRATEIPDNYGTFDGSGLEVTVKKVPIGTTDRSKYYEGYQFKLK